MGVGKLGLIAGFVFLFAHKTKFRFVSFRFVLFCFVSFCFLFLGFGFKVSLRTSFTDRNRVICQEKISGGSLVDGNYSANLKSQVTRMGKVTLLDSEKKIIQITSVSHWTRSPEHWYYWKIVEEFRLKCTKFKQVDQLVRDNLSLLAS